MTRTPMLDHRAFVAGRSRQRGALALLVSALLFLMSMLILLYVNRGAVAEQRMSANELRAKDAFAQAVAGLDHALAYMQNGGISQDGDAVPDSVGNGQYRATFCRLQDQDPPACPTTAGPIGCNEVPGTGESDSVLAFSCGWSDDNSAVQRVVQHLRGTASTAGNASTPLISRSSSFFTGGASVFNFENDLTVWSGGSFDSNNATGKTYVRDTFTVAADAPTELKHLDFVDNGCNNPPADYACTTDGPTLGHDVVFGDNTLALASKGEFFQRFLGRPPEVYRQSVVEYDITGDQFADTVTKINASGEQAVIWVEGDLTIGSNLQLGDFDGPSHILIVNGNLTFNGGPTLHGLVFTFGTVSGNGNARVVGSLITAENVEQGTGNLNIIYSSGALSRITNIGRAAKVAGTFRDW